MSCRAISTHIVLVLVVVTWGEVLNDTNVLHLNTPQRLTESDF